MASASDSKFGKKSGPILPDTFVGFSDGSRLKDGRIGAGFTIKPATADISPNDLTASLPICSTGCSFEAETYGLRKLAERLLELSARYNRSYNCILLVDNKGVLDALFSGTSKDRGIRKCCQALNRLNDVWPTTLSWIPSHLNIPGNEEADILAKAGANSVTKTADDFYTSQRYALTTLKNNVNTARQTEWDKAKVGRFSHGLFPKIKPHATAFNPNRKTSSMWAQFHSGFGRWQASVAQRNRDQSPFCVACKSAGQNIKDDIDHLFTCQHNAQRVDARRTLCAELPFVHQVLTWNKDDRVKWFMCQGDLQKKKPLGESRTINLVTKYLVSIGF